MSFHPKSFSLLVLWALETIPTCFGIFYFVMHLILLFSPFFQFMTDRPLAITLWALFYETILTGADTPTIWDAQSFRRSLGWENRYQHIMSNGLWDMSYGREVVCPTATLLRCMSVSGLLGLRRAPTAPAPRHSFATTALGGESVPRFSLQFLYISYPLFHYSTLLFLSHCIALLCTFSRVLVQASMFSIVFLLSTLIPRA